MPLPLCYDLQAPTHPRLAVRDLFVGPLAAIKLSTTQGKAIQCPDPIPPTAVKRHRLTQGSSGRARELASTSIDSLCVDINLC